MALEFTRAIEVEPGDPVTSRQLTSLARAFNDRLRSGAGDGTFRILFALHGWLRSLRDYVGEGEFWKVLQQIEPESGFRWPSAPPGGLGGANRANPLGAFVLGTPGFDLESEFDRLQKFPWGTTTEIGDRDAWELGKAQRGAYDATTGRLASPSFTAAREHFKIRYNGRSKFGNAWGGYQPAPEVSVTGCEDPDPGDEYPAPVNYEVFFTSIVSNPKTAGLHGTVTDNGDGTWKLAYAGTCIPATDPYSDHVAGIATMPWAYYVFLNDGSVDELPSDEWLQGPYQGSARLTKTEHNLQRGVNAFIREFRGSTTQRSSASYHLQEALDFQRFLSRQYLLAPAYGTSAGEGSVDAVYPKFQWTGNAASGAFATCVQSSSTSWVGHAEYVIAGVLITATGLSTATEVEMLDGETLLTKFTVTPGEGGVVEQAAWFEPARTVGNLKFRAAKVVRFGGSGSLEIEVAELADYKPLVHDAYLLLRVAGATAGDVDGRGPDEEQARVIGETYHAKGCLLNWHQQGTTQETEAELSTNAVLDSIRRWSKCVRMLRRQDLVAYGVQDGKSILWFRRLVWGEDGTPAVDQWNGLGPSRTKVPQGGLREGVTYEVRSGVITYAGTDYQPGQTFTASAEKEWKGGDGVYEHTGIFHAAPAGGTTNQWLMDVVLHPYHSSDTSAWWAPGFADWYPVFNRCHFGSPEISNSPQALWHMGYGQRISGTYGGVLVPESPSGYNFMPISPSWLGRTSVNEVDCGGNATCESWMEGFYRSCQLYQAPAEIEKVEAVTGTDGTELVKVTLTGRLQHCDTAPSSISEDPSTWSAATIAAEPYRTLENGIREYLLNQYFGDQCTAGDEPPYNVGGPSGQPGNAAANTSFYTFPDDPWGSCFPTFILTRLVPEPYQDTNESQDSSDTPFTSDEVNQMELYLRCMAEGYVDGATSLDYACRLGVYTVFDFSFENLCKQAFGGRWIQVLPESVTGTRGEGFGPLPNTEAYAEIFNQLSRAVNLLTKVRIMLPMRLESWADLTTVDETVGAWAADGSGLECTGGVAAAIIEREMMHPGMVWGPPDWIAGLQGAHVSSQLQLPCVGAAWTLRHTRLDSRMRWEPIDPAAMEAIPEPLRGLLESSPVVLMRIDEALTHIGGRQTVIGDSQECCFAFQQPCPGFWFDGVGTFWAFPEQHQTSFVCVATGGVLSAPPIGRSYSAWGRTAGGAECPIGPVNSLTPTAISDSTAVVEVPLKEMEGEH